MNYVDETLGAYVDGELDASQRAEFEAAMAADPALAQRIERLRILRNELLTAFSGATQEPVPRHLLDLVHSPDVHASVVTAPGSGRLANMARERAARAGAPRRSWAWPEWSAVAASLVMGMMLGHTFLQAPDAGLRMTAQGRLLARSDLAQALSTQLASEQARDAAVRIGLSFRDKGGSYCRTFALQRGHSLAGLACRENEGWRVQVLAQADHPPGGGAEPAASAMPPAVLSAVEAEISGAPLDAAAEAAARQSKWGVP
jgi:hypothetical protein